MIDIALEELADVPHWHPLLSAYRERQLAELAQIDPQPLLPKVLTGDQDARRIVRIVEGDLGDRGAFRESRGRDQGKKEDEAECDCGPFLGHGSPLSGRKAGPIPASGGVRRGWDDAQNIAPRSSGNRQAAI